jgi:putative GTP pyrophosphokinase
VARAWHARLSDPAQDAYTHRTVVAAPPLTTSQINKAGRILRGWMQDKYGSPERVPDEVVDAYRVMLRFRQAHQGPLTTATVSLRWRVNREGCRVEVSQRLKRSPTILGKLDREKTMALANMQDIGGCRAVLVNLDEVWRLKRRIEKGTPRPGRVYDYIKQPRESGYRGIHLIVPYRGRNIEIQLRTGVMHEWAIFVERLSGRLGEDLKSSAGPQPVLDWLEAVSEAMALEESGEDVDTDRVERIRRLREGALPYMGGGHP